MDNTIYLDTNITLWLTENRLNKLSTTAARIIDTADQLYISPMVYLELEYLHEIKRGYKRAATILQHLEKTAGITICEKPFSKIIITAGEITWTRDPFDRIITAHAALDKNILLTADEHILQHYKHARW